MLDPSALRAVPAAGLPRRPSSLYARAYARGSFPGGPQRPCGRSESDSLALVNECGVTHGSLADHGCDRLRRTSGLRALHEMADQSPRFATIKLLVLGRRCPPAGPKGRFAEVDLNDATQIRAAIERIAPDVVIHTAGRTPPAPDEELYRTNFWATLHLLKRAAIAAKRRSGSFSRARPPSWATSSRRACR